MKTKHIIIAALCVVFQSATVAKAQESDSLGLLGDNFDLYGALELFKNSENSEAFEKAINLENNKINNLDLNSDGKVDYIKVIDYQKDNARAITLQVDVDDKEAQNVAVIEIDKTGAETATAQIIGDEDLYGENYIVEPMDTKEEGSIVRAVYKTPLVVNVWLWRPMRHYYGPKYVVWVSPWRYAYYPVWFAPWGHVAWRVHHKRVVHYRVHCHRVKVHRAPHIHGVYHPHRKSSKVVQAKRAALRPDAVGASKSGGTRTNDSGRKQNKTEQKPRGAKQNSAAQKGSGGKKQNGGGGRQGGGKKGGGKRGR